MGIGRAILDSDEGAELLEPLVPGPLDSPRGVLALVPRLGANRQDRGPVRSETRRALWSESDLISKLALKPRCMQDLECSRFR